MKRNISKSVLQRMTVTDLEKALIEKISMQLIKELVSNTLLDKVEIRQLKHSFDVGLSPHRISVEKNIFLDILKHIENTATLKELYLTFNNGYGWVHSPGTARIECWLHLEKATLTLSRPYFGTYNQYDYYGCHKIIYISHRGLTISTKMGLGEFNSIPNNFQVLERETKSSTTRESNPNDIWNHVPVGSTALDLIVFRIRTKPKEQDACLY